MSFIMTTLKDQHGNTLRDEYGNAVYDSPRLTLQGIKTQTRRLWKPGMRLVEENGVKTVYNPPNERHPNGTRKWVVGREYAVKPKRSMPTVWWREHEHIAFENNIELAHESDSLHSPYYFAGALLHAKKHHPDNIEGYLKKCRFKPLHIRVLDLEKQVLRDITFDDCLAEGVQSRLSKDLRFREFYDYGLNQYEPRNIFTPEESYKTLLEATNGGKPVPWDTEVCKITFEQVL